MKIKLKDNTELTVTESSTATKITADFSSAEDIENFRKKLTDENLSAFLYSPMISPVSSFMYLNADRF